MRGRVRWIALAVGAIVVVFGVVLALNVNGNDPNVTKGRFTGSNDPAPAFTVKTLDGTELSLADLAGKTVVVNFWNSWCQPCQQEAPALATFYDRHKDEPDCHGRHRAHDTQTATQLREAQGVGWTVGSTRRARPLALAPRARDVRHWS
jgi:thiol-disulfide isomerase/thioredoxin